MKTCYSIELGNKLAVLDVMKAEDRYVITRINVPINYRGQGYGTELLRQVCEDADYEEKDLILEIVPSGGLDYDQLEAWYASFGFERIEYGEWCGYYLREYDGKNRGKTVFTGISTSKRKAKPGSTS